MTRSHYEVLQVSPDASRAEIRTAYRAACLRTHPDKAKAEDKKKAEYEFRRVQQAYEVLSDEEKRNAYDNQRTNPVLDRTFQAPQPPQNQPRYQYQYQYQNAYPFFFHDAFGPSSSRSRARPQDPFNHPFFNNNNDFGFGRSPFASFGWPFGGGGRGSDPFEDMMSSHRRMADELSRMAAQFQSRPFPIPPQTQTQPEPEHNRAGDAFTSASTPLSTSTPTSTSTSTRQPSSRSNSAAMWSFMDSNAQGGHWVSESRSESWVNGQRHTTHKRRDLNGVEHVTHTYPDGTTRYFVNGVEQQRGPRAIDDDSAVRPSRGNSSSDQQH